MHIGEKIRARAKELRVGPTELARRIKTSKQNVYGIFGRSSIDTDLLVKLSKALEFDFFAYYGGTSKPELTEQQGAYANKRNRRPSAATSEEEIDKLQKELSDLHEKYDLLRALFELKTGGKAPGSE